MWNRLEISHTWNGEPISDAERARVDFQRTADGDLTVQIEAPFHGDSAPDALAGAVWGLWEFEVVELFLVGADGRYLEAEFGPHGHHLVLQLAGPREIVAQELPVVYTAEIAEGRWRGEAHIEAPLVPWPIARVNAFAIHGDGAARRYLAHAALPGPKPDFHQPDRFPAV